MDFNHIPKQLEQKQPSQEEDYVQQMIKANAPKHGNSFSLGTTQMSQADQIKILNKERKSKKKGKKGIKIQGYTQYSP